MKVQINDQIINPFGGINFVVDEIRKSGILELIDNQLGERPKQAQYSYCELFLNLWNIFFCGGNCAEYINEHLKCFLKSIR
jgi:hypothetical protein